ncbi:MAG: hypothetical protein ABWK15_02955 [Dissulfuribacterales bacterium]
MTIFDTAVSMEFFYIFIGVVVSLTGVVTAREEKMDQNAHGGDPEKTGTPWPFFAAAAVMSALVAVNSVYYLKAWAADNNFLYGLGNIKYYEANKTAAPQARLKILDLTLSHLDASMEQNPVESHYDVYYGLASNYYADVMKDLNPDAAKYQLNEGIKRLLACKDVTWEPEDLYMTLAGAYTRLGGLDNAIRYSKVVVDDWDHQNFYTRYNLADILMKRADKRSADGDAAGARDDLREAGGELKKGEAVIVGREDFAHVYGQMLELEKKIEKRLEKTGAGTAPAP